MDGRLSITPTVDVFAFSYDEVRPSSLAAYGADISANANTTNHPTMRRLVTAPAITFSFSFVV